MNAFGEVEDVRVCPGNDNINFNVKGYMIVRFRHPRSAQTAIYTLSGASLIIVFRV